MKRLLTLAGALACAYAVACAFIFIDFYLLFGYLNPGLIRSSEVRAAFWTALIPLTLFAMRPIFRRTESALTRAAALTAVCFAAAFAAEAVYFAYLAGHGWFRNANGVEEPLSNFVVNLLASVHSPFTFLIAMTMFSRWLAGSADQHSAETRLNRLETRLVEARSQLLRSQLHPHFLFNALNSVAALIRHEPQRASEMLDRLSRFYAIAAATEGRHTVRLEEEIEFVRQYIEIEQIRFGPRLTTSIDVPPDLLAIQVPVLILQPLAENAIKHGIARQPGPGAIVIRAGSDGRSLHVVIENGGVVNIESLRNGVGLGNTRERLHQLYGGEASLVIAPVEQGTRVTLTIPLRMEMAGAAA
jgi:two-component system, LytTR family, sensor kinase